ncbi:MAG: AAA family ATPase [Alphaproteobacteria bacterium]|nr:AAA family ATPase [Alphaproteobacteria bacterium]
MSDDDFFDDLPTDMDIAQSDVEQSAPIVRVDQPVPMQTSGEDNLTSALLPVVSDPKQVPSHLSADVTHGHAMDQNHLSPAVVSGNVVSGNDASQKILQIPQISIQAFYETTPTAQLLQMSAGDRRMSRTHITMQAGGIVAAKAFYQNIPTPNLIIIESRLAHNELLLALDDLASVCDAGTKVCIMGHENDIMLYRDLVSKGVSDYLVLPTSPLNLIECIYNIYHDPQSKPLGKKFAFFGAKGGVGSSTLAHNIAYSIAYNIQDSVTVVDMDFAFGTLGLNFNQDPSQNIAELLKTPDRIDEATIDKMLLRHGGYLNLLPNMTSIEKSTEISVAAVGNMLQCMSQSVANSIIDLPHVWNDWVKSTLVQADQIIITATPDLASLRNTKNIIDFLKTSRVQDSDPLIVMNQMGMLRKPEIKTKDFADTVGASVVTEIAYDPKLFGTAANNGQMLQEFSRNEKILGQLDDLAQLMLHKKTQQVSAKKNLFDMFMKKKSA